MEFLDVEKKFKNKLDDLWNEYANLSCVQDGYEMRKSIKKDAILFIGINPAFSKGKLEEADGRHVYLDLDTISPKHPYFSKMIEISRYCKGHNEGKDYPWAELDLLNIRESNQNKIKQLFIDENTKGLVERNYKLSLEIMEEAQPKVIVVCNSFARTLLEKSYKVEFDDEIGTFRIKKEGKLYNVPIFFTSMLSGQRALDLGSYRRLQWHINSVL